MRLRYAFLIVLTAMLLSACNFSLAADITPPPGYVPPTPVPTLGPMYPAEAPDVQNGGNIYASKCLPCHGERGLGDGAQGKQLPVTVAALGLTEVARPASPARWFTVVSQGNIDRFMPPFASLPAKDRWDVVAYALTLHTTPGMIQQGKQLFESQCRGCDTSFFQNQEKMAALSLDDLARTVREGGDGLTAFGSGLSDDQAYAVAAYLRTLSFGQPEPATATLAPTLEMPATAGSGGPGIAVTAVEGTPSSGATPVQGDTPSAQITPGQGTPAPTIEVPPPANGGTVTGTVINKSGATLPAGAAVTLRGFDHSQDSSGPQETFTQAGTLAADGSFTFENVDLPEGRILLAEMEYQGITYQSQFKTVQSGDTQVILDPLTVYESTDDFSTLAIDQLHVAFDFGTGQAVQVFQIYSFSNKSNKAIIVKTDGSQVPFIQTPEGAQDTGIEAGQDTAPFAPAADGVAILPSDAPYSLIAFFSLPYNPKGTSIDLPLVLRTDAVSVFVPQGIKLKSQDLSDAGTQDISGTSFRMYSSKQLAAGSNLNFMLSGKAEVSTPASPQASTRLGLIYGAGALGLALIGLGVWMILRDRRAALEAEEDELDGDLEFEDPESAMDAIIALDDLYRAGKIPEAAYRSRRAQLKEQLRKLESGD